jgi:hypothetical protein
VPAYVEPTADQRIVEAAAQLPAHGGVTGWASLRWQGGHWFDGTDRDQQPRPVVLAVGSRHTKRANRTVSISQELVPPTELRRCRGVRVTSALWSVAFEMRKAKRDVDAVVAFDMAAYADLVSAAELDAFIDQALWIRQGVQRVRDLLSLLDENAWSPMESVMRLTWQQGGFPRALTNHPVHDLAGRFVGTPDLLDPAAGVYGMYDGALHLAGQARHGDVGKEATYRALGLEGVTMMAGDLSDPGSFLQRLREAYARAGRRPADARGWLAEPPAWWVPTFTVTQRRALSADDRTRLLRYRSAS